METTKNTNTTSSYRILIVEDDQRQINWAKESLKEHKLTFVESEYDFYHLISREGKERDDFFCFDEFDFVITDMNLPIKKGESTSPEIGKAIFEVLLRYTFRFGKIKGCALLSNLEHHLHTNNNPGLSLRIKYWEGRQKEYSFSQWNNEEHYTEKRYYTIGNSLGKTGWKAILFWDMAMLNDKTPIVSKTGEIRSTEEWPKLIKNEGWEFLKPFKKVVEDLIFANSPENI